MARTTSAATPSAKGLAASRLWGWLPALLVAQLGLALWAALRAQPDVGGSSTLVALAVGNQLLFLLRALPLLLLLGSPLATQPARRAARPPARRQRRQ